MSLGKISKIYNNYGLIDYEEDTLPFKITKKMIKTIDGLEYIEYTNEVKFRFKSNNRVRNREIREAQDIEFIGENWIRKERVIENNYLKKVRSKFENFCFKIPEEVDTDQILYEYLKNIGFKPRMLNYLIPGVFIPKDLYKICANLQSNNIKIEELEFEPEIIVHLDLIDNHLRINILKWILGIEDSYKSFISRVTSNKEIGVKIAEGTINEWSKKSNKFKKQISRAHNKYIYREFSDNYDYINNPNFAPIDDLMEQLDLSDLKAFLKVFYDQTKKFGFFSLYLENIIMSLTTIDELMLLRNDAAHGKTLIPNFSDPDYNGNWDLEFDNIDKRSKVDDWYLFEPLEKNWLEKGVDSKYNKNIIHTIFGNPYRKAWMELHYIYFSIISKIDKFTFNIFFEEAKLFLMYDSDIMSQIKKVNMIHPKLSDMGPTTLEAITSIPAPYKEIANEAFDIWKIFE